MAKKKVAVISTKKAQIENRIKWIYNRNGTITPDMVVEDALNPASPLHNAGFEWDDAKAAHNNRLDHARRLIASVKLTIRNTKHTYSTVAYVRDPHVPTNEQGYVATERARKDPKLARECVDAELKTTLSHMERLRDLSSVLNLQHVVEDAMQQFLNTIRQALKAA